MPFTEENIIATRAKLAAVGENVHKLMLVGEIFASHRMKQLHSL